ncbi:MAG TPA: hypothetical protein PLL28_09215 [Chitinophagales bacterium]|nr:hypothetical protein [Chitinophagales bacterium]HMX03613.1 hypothetical protein [Chitinophagales bacterium]HMZ88747.1 hypothetical protein [Chitinophagales bacterium]HNA56625.1 hypothetical protein [Chitinophagales bacterium]HNE45488.1 hypothetical protein [Chitinophagales bacterium]
MKHLTQGKVSLKGGSESITYRNRLSGDDQPVCFDGCNFFGRYDK